ncbi:DUF7835 family putative zinc beta-ribbon protein [Haladaptatus sp. NG-SE-30]
MAAKHHGFQTVVELCEPCSRNTSHEVWIEIRTESKQAENVKFSREPYRVTMCKTCGETTRQRMNNA